MVENKIEKICRKMGWNFEWRDYPKLAFAERGPYYIVFWWDYSFKEKDPLFVWKVLNKALDSEIQLKSSNDIILSFLWTKDKKYIKKLLKHYNSLIPG